MFHKILETKDVNTIIQFCKKSKKHRDFCKAHRDTISKNVLGADSNSKLIKILNNQHGGNGPYTFVTSDNKRIIVNNEFINNSIVLKNLIEDISPSEIKIIPLINVKYDTLTSLIDLLQNPKPISDLAQLTRLIKAANYLEIPTLEDFLATNFAKWLENKTSDELKKLI